MRRVVLVSVVVAACSGQGPTPAPAIAAPPDASHDPCRSSPSLWSEAPGPIVIGHRGSGNVTAPENTYAAFDSAASLGVAIETDAWSTADGQLVLIHDPTVDRTSGTTAGAVRTLTYQQLSSLDVSQVYRPDLFSPQSIPLFEQYLLRYGSDHLLIPEVKGGAGDAVRMATVIRNHCMQRSVLVQSAFLEDLSAVRSVDPNISTSLLSSTQVAPQVAIDNDLFAVLINYINIDTAYVASMHEIGVRVIAYTVDSLVDAERLIDQHVDGIISDDPGLMKWAHRSTPSGSTVVQIPSSLVGSGWRPYSSSPGALPGVESAAVTFMGEPVVGDTSFTRFYLPFLRMPSGIVKQAIDASIRVERFPSSNKVSIGHVGLRFCWTTDKDAGFLGTPDTTGYYFAYHLDGHVELSRSANGKRVMLASGLWSALAQGESVTLHAEIDGTALTITRPDIGKALMASVLANSCAGFVSVYGSGAVPGVASATLTY
jgi:glycerophosphoryl diester phosphodiesterase